MSYTRVNPNSWEAMAQASGIGAFENVGDWTWMLYPAEYSFLAPADSTPLPPIRPAGLGCGCGGCGGGCKEGLGQTGVLGTNLFTSMDPTQWGWGEWAALAAGLWVVSSAVSDTRRAARATRRAYRAARSTN